MSYAENIDVFEHGIVVSDGEHSPAGLSIIATTRQPIYNCYSLTLVDRDGTSLNDRAVHVLEVSGPTLSSTTTRRVMSGSSSVSRCTTSTV